MKQLTLVVALSLAATLGAQGQGAGSVPFRATIDTEVTPLGPCGATCLMLEIGGTGHALHLGQTTIQGPSQIDFATGEQSGASTLMAADGSTLTIAFAGHFTPGPGPADAAFSGAWQVVEGTGRFQDASGGGSYHGSASGASGLLLMEGTIGIPGRR